MANNRKSIYFGLLHDNGTNDCFLNIIVKIHPPNNSHDINNSITNMICNGNRLCGNTGPTNINKTKMLCNNLIKYSKYPILE